jgi:hypothetical protein
MNTTGHETMTAMVGTVLRAARGSALPAACCALLTVGVLVGGCARLIDGAPRAGEPVAPPARPVPIADLLIEPTRFPAHYPAAVLPPKDIDRVLGEVDGVPAGSEVTPPECAPLPLLGTEQAAAQGTDDDSGNRLIVTVVRPVPSVHSRATQLAECPSFTVTSVDDPDDVSTVTVKLPPPPPVDADDSYAVDQAVTSETDQSVTKTLTFVALLGDVRVTASWQASSDAEPDATTLDTLFSAAVLKVRRAVPR